MASDSSPTHPTSTHKPTWPMKSFIAQVAWPFRWYLLGMAAVQLTWSIDLTLRPYLIKWILNTATQGQSDVMVYQLALLSALFCVTLGIVIGAFRCYDWIIMRMEPELRQHIADTLMKHVIRHDHAFFQNHMSGALTDQVNNVTRSVPQMLKVFVERFFVITFALIIAFATMLQFHKVLACVIASWVLLFVGATAAIARKAQQLAKHAAAARSRATGSLTDTFSNMLSVRLFTGEKHEEQLLHHAFTQTAHAERDRDWLLLKIQAFHTFSFLILEVISLTILVQGFSSGWVTPGDFSLILGINFSLIWILWGLMQDLTMFIKAFGEISQGLKTLTTPLEMLDAPHASLLRIHEGTVVFDNVTFHYSETNKIFDSLSTTIYAGQKVGLVGCSGSGKSTFVNLMLRLLDIQGGRICIDNQNIAEVTQESLRQAIALIPQDPSLFHRTIRENIRYGRPNASDAEIAQAARYAHADEFIESMPLKYDTLVGERGLTLSGGQRQRIAIARAFLKEAPILMLDEATSALDSVTEAYIQDSLTHLMQNRTTLVIAHRLSTLMHMDRILVFDKGLIVEDGTHQELLARKGLYSTLWNAQIHGFLPDQIVS